MAVTRNRVRWKGCSRNRTSRGVGDDRVRLGFLEGRPDLVCGCFPDPLTFPRSAPGAAPGSCGAGESTASVHPTRGLAATLRRGRRQARGRAGRRLRTTSWCTSGGSRRSIWSASRFSTGATSSSSRGRRTGRDHGRSAEFEPRRSRFDGRGRARRSTSSSRGLPGAASKSLTRSGSPESCGRQPRSLRAARAAGRARSRYGLLIVEDGRPKPA